MAIDKNKSYRSSLLKKRSRDRKLQLIFSTPVLVSLVFVILLLLGFYWSDGISKTISQAADTTSKMTKKIGFQIKTINIIGRKKTPQDVLQKAIMFKRGDHIFKQDLNLIREQIEQIDWIKSAVVSREFPDKLTIYLGERIPIALWTQHKKYYLVDSDGAVILSDKIEPYANLPFISGDGAAQHIDKTLEVLKKFPDLKKHIKSMIRIRKRRWDMIIFKSTIVKLPEDVGAVTPLDAAFTKLEAVIKQKKISPGGDGYIDLRIPGKTIIPGNLNTKIHKK